jgi:hypothetical protein
MADALAALGSMYNQRIGVTFVGLGTMAGLTKRGSWRPDLSRSITRSRE